MSAKENNQQSAPHTRRFRITGRINAREYGPDKITIEDGDTCVVKVGAPYRNGDLVLVECVNCAETADGSTAYHAYYYQTCNGQIYRFYLAKWPDFRCGRTRYKEEGRKIIVGPILKIAGKDVKTESRKKRKAEREEVLMTWGWPYFGVHRDDLLIVEESGDAPLGKLILMEEGEHTALVRVCRVDKDVVRICGDGEAEAEDIDRSRVIGPVVEIKHDDCVESKVKALRDKLEGLAESDSTLALTKAYEVEREIYDLEHPKEETAEDEDEFEWPDLIDDKGVL